MNQGHQMNDAINIIDRTKYLVLLVIVSENLITDIHFNNRSSTVKKRRYNNCFLF